MKKFRAYKKRRSLIPLLILLAVACVTVTELIACYFFDRALFETVTTPVARAAEAAVETGRRAVGAAAQWGARAAERAALWWEEATAPEPTLPPDGQLAGEAALSQEGGRLDPAITELKMVGTQGWLTGGNYRTSYFNQGDPQWADKPYGGDTIGPYGCGPTAMAMAVYSMTGQATDPAQMAQWCYENGHWASRSGSYLSIVEGAAAGFGLAANPIPERTPGAVRDALLSGDMLVALMGPGHFTSNGHFILLRGLTLGGGVLVADPASEERSLSEWDIQLILDELSPSTAHDAPLWVLSERAPESPPEGE